jgi:ribonuclease-3
MRIILQQDVEHLERMLGYEWRDRGELLTALIHTTWANETGVTPNQRLEFLGDSVLDLVSAEWLMVNMPSAREGVLSQARAGMVKASSLAQRSRELGLGGMILLGKGADYLRDVESVLADTLEAVIGAAYLDGGIEAARTVILNAGILRTQTTNRGE